MRKIISLSILLAASLSVSAQHIYSNAEITSTSDLIGTSRYVSMGGALGALGADISAISSNPAAIGLFRKSDISLTAGLLWPKNRDYAEGDNLTHGTFDQMGFVTAWRLDDDVVKYVNFGFNYQKKFNFANGFYADNPNTYGLSQMDQIAQIANLYPSDYNLIGTAWNACLFNQDKDGFFYNPSSAYNNRYTHYSTGSTQSFDLNASINLNDRAYIGATFGIENVDYNRYSMYTEEREFKDGDQAWIDDYELYNDQDIDGYGINFKVGTIVRPFEDSPFRVGLAIETPTWYRLKSKTIHEIKSKWDNEGNYSESNYYSYPGYDDSYLEYIVRTPWRARLSIGSTLDKYLAWGVEYEFANYAKNHMKYPDDYEYYDGSSFAGKSDRAMNRLNKDMLRGQHTLKAGIEFKLADDWALRFGYNYISSIYKDKARLDQTRPSDAFDYVTSTNYMNLSDINILACGLGYRYKKFYMDMTYKFRQQNGDFYAFDDSFTNDPQFRAANPDLAGVKLEPVELNLNRHTITWTVGFKF